MKKTWLAVLWLTLIALVLRVYRLDFVSLRGDEAFTVIFVQRTWDGLWKGIRLIEPNPPLMYLVLRAWVVAAGASEFVTRYFSAFFGVLCVPLVYRLAREMMGGARGRTAALLAALLMAINPYQVWHSQDVRNYTMWPALSLLALVFFWQWWKRETAMVAPAKPPSSSTASRFGILSMAPGYATLVLYMLATLASLYTHYYDTFILVAENIFVFAVAGLGRRWTTLARWTGAQVVLALVYLPWVLFGTNRVTTYGEQSAEQSVPLLDQFSRTLSTFVLSDTVPEEMKSLLWLPLALALVVVLLYLARHAARREQAVFIFLYIAVPTVALFAISLGRPLFLERYLNGIAPAYYIVFAVGLAALYRPEFGRHPERSEGSRSTDRAPLSATQRHGLSHLHLRAVQVLRAVFATLAPPARAGEQSPMLIPKVQVGDCFAPSGLAMTDVEGYHPFPLARAAGALFALALVFFLATSAYALSNYYFDPAYAKAPDWRALGKLISTLQKPGDIIVQNYNEMSALYYRSGTLPVVTIPKDFWPTPDDEKSLEQVNRDYDRIWFLPAAPDSWDPNHFSERYLQRHDNLLMDAEVTRLRLQLYATPRQFVAQIIPINARVGQATLVGYQVEGLSGVQVPNHATLGLRLYWRPLEKIGKDLHVFVHLVDAGGQVLAQQDGIPAAGSWPTLDWLPGELIVDAHRLNIDTTPGAYSLIAGMYDPVSTARVPVADANGVAQPNDRAIIAQVTVTP